MLCLCICSDSLVLKEHYFHFRFLLNILCSLTSESSASIDIYNLTKSIPVVWKFILILISISYLKFCFVKLDHFITQNCISLSGEIVLSYIELSFGIIFFRFVFYILIFYSRRKIHKFHSNHDWFHYVGAYINFAILPFLT